MGLLYWVLRQPAATSAWFWLKLGLGAGAIWLVYPGYYAAPVLLVAPLLSWRAPLAWVRGHFPHVLLLGAGFATPLLAAEALSRYGGGPPFWAISYDLSLHILQGDPNEGYTFLFAYLWQVENALGFVLLLLLALAVGQKLQSLRTEGLAAIIPHTALQKLLLAALLLFLLHATAAAGWHRIVWYGRLLRLYMPFLVLAGVAALGAVRWQLAASWLALSSCLVAVVSYLLFLVAYARIVYPSDISGAYKLSCIPEDRLLYFNEVKTADKLLYRVHSARVAPVANCPSVSGDSLTILVNFALLYPLMEASHRELPSFGPAVRVLLDAPLNRSFPAYEFEGLRPAERAEARRRQFRLRILRVEALPATNINGLLLR